MILLFLYECARQSVVLHPHGSMGCGRTSTAVDPQMQGRKYKMPEKPKIKRDIRVRELKQTSKIGKRQHTLFEECPPDGHSAWLFSVCAEACGSEGGPAGVDALVMQSLSFCGVNFCVPDRRRCALARVLVCICVLRPVSSDAAHAAGLHWVGVLFGLFR